jgi:hypothetical protein
MALNLVIPPETEARLAEKARSFGIDTATYAIRILRSAAAEPTLDEVLAPVRKKFAESGMTEDELADVLEREKHAAREVERGRPFDE